MAAGTGLLSVQRFQLKDRTPTLAVHVHQASSGTGVEKDAVFFNEPFLTIQDDF